MKNIEYVLKAINEKLEKLERDNEVLTDCVKKFEKELEEKDKLIEQQSIIIDGLRALSGGVYNS
jgi:ribosome recycling factor